MKVETLNHIPLSGDYEEHYFGEEGNALWTRFYDDFDEWVGIFQIGSGFSTTKIVEIGDRYLILAGGIVYLIHAQERTLLGCLNGRGYEDAIYHKHSDQIILTDGLHLLIWNGVEILWKSERISLDGISFMAIEDGTVNGNLNDMTDEGCEFTFDVTRRRIKAKWKYHEQFDDRTKSFLEIQKIGRKCSGPWWKFW